MTVADRRIRRTAALVALGALLHSGCGARTELYAGRPEPEGVDAGAIDATDDAAAPDSEAQDDAPSDSTVADGNVDAGPQDAAQDAFEGSGPVAPDAADAGPDRDASPGPEAGLDGQPGTDADATIEPDADAAGVDADAGDAADAPPDACDGPCPPAPRPLAPTTGCAVGTHTPTLSWFTPPGYGLVHVDVCAERSCANVLWSADVAGDSVTVGTSLPSGYVYWRLYESDGDGGVSSPTSPTWQFAVLGTNSAPIMSSWNNFHDLEGDGFSDLIVYGGPSNLPLEEYRGSASGIASTGVELGMSGPLWAAAGDVNGDGFGDVVAMVAVGQTLHLVTYLGGRRGADTAGTDLLMPATTLPGARSEGGFVADVNTDGYADWVSVDLVSRTPSISVYFGSGEGLTGATETVALPSGTGAQAFAYYAGDVNADGYPDLLVADPSLHPSTPPVSSGGAYLYFGGASAFGTAPSQVIPRRPMACGGSPGTAFGTSATFGDLDGDGYGDVQIGDNGGSAYLYPGSASGLVDTSPGCTVESLAGADSVLGLGGGDFDGDGLCEVAVAESTAMGQSQNVDVYEAGFFFFGTPCCDSGFPPASLGDTNGDSFSDFAVSWAGGVADSGTATDGLAIFYGSPSLASAASQSPGPGPSTTLLTSGRPF